MNETCAEDITDAGIYECSTVLTGEYLGVSRTTNLLSEYGLTKILAYSGVNVLKNAKSVRIPNIVNGDIQDHENLKVQHPRTNRSNRSPYNVAKPDSFATTATE